MKKPIPVIFAILSLIYLVFVLNAGGTAMIGDDLKGDPGSKLLPVFISVIMFVSSVYLLLKKDTDIQTDIKEKGSFYLTLIISVLYVLLFRFIGFLLITNFLIFTLAYFYSFKISITNLKLFFTGLLFSSGLVFILYTISRLVSRSLIKYSRVLELVWMRSSVTMFFTNLIVILLLLFSINGIYKKVTNEKKTREIGIIIFLSVNSTILLFLVFKQLFNVSLVQGLIKF